MACAPLRDQQGNRPFETTVDALTDQSSFGDGDVGAVATGVQGGGHAATIGDEEVTAEVVVVYADGETPTREALDNVREMATNAMTEDVAAEAEAIELGVDGRTVTASYTTTPAKAFGLPSMGMGMGAGMGGESAVATLMVFPAAAILGTFFLGIGGSAVDGSGSGRPGPAPSVRFEWRYVPDGSPPLRITHTGGDTVSGSNVEVTVSGPAEITTTDRQEYAAGDELVASVEGSIAGETARVVWVSDDGRRSEVLDSFVIP